MKNNTKNWKKHDDNKILVLGIWEKTTMCPMDSSSERVMKTWSCGWWSLIALMACCDKKS